MTPLFPIAILSAGIIGWLVWSYNAPPARLPREVPDTCRFSADSPSLVELIRSIREALTRDQLHTGVVCVGVTPPPRPAAMFLEDRWGAQPAVAYIAELSPDPERSTSFTLRLRGGSPRLSAMPKASSGRVASAVRSALESLPDITEIHWRSSS